MTGRRSHGRLSALNGVVHQGSLDLHELQGTRKRIWAVKVSGNWRVTFGFADNEAEHVDYEDYH